MRTTLLLLCGLAAALGAEEPAKDWKVIFDGKTLNGWKASELPEAWRVENGAIVGDGERSHLFYMGQECVNCEFKAMVKLNHGGNSGMYFRAKFMPGWPEGYEAQVNNTHPDWRRTGSLYAIQDVKEQLVPDDTWWTQHIIADGNHIQIKVNGKTVVDYVDEKNRFTRGYVALQQHNKGSIVMYKDLMLRTLPVKK
jgi:3-keto-disaccharide hydrolase